MYADCDPDDRVGCASGLVCGVDNCAQFHEISAATGFFAASDCCEGTPRYQYEYALFSWVLLL